MKKSSVIALRLNESDLASLDAIKLRLTNNAPYGVYISTAVAIRYALRETADRLELKNITAELPEKGS